MARPNIDPNELQSGQEGWDALLQDIINAIANRPFPAAQYANFASLPTAADYDRCIAVVIDTNDIYISVSGSWKKLTREV